VIQLRVKEHLAALLAQEDTDGDCRITCDDRGPGCYRLGSLEVRGQYALSNLLQELALADDSGCELLELDAALLYEPPAQRLSRAIRRRCWPGLVRCLDRQQLARMVADPKAEGVPRLYLPPDDEPSWEYYRGCTDVEVLPLPPEVDPEKPGLLGLACPGEPLPYLVPGGRFNEMYGWDSYFIARGLLHDGYDLWANHLLTHQLYQVRHYGQILNANRSYYLTRSQPPLLTALIRLLPQPPSLEAMQGAMLDYQQCWQHPQRQTSVGLTRYFDRGVGIPPETEPGHFDDVLRPYAQAAGLSVEEFRLAYLRRQLRCGELDDYFVHDRALRESGHDTSYRLEGRCAQLATVDLNALLYRYEIDVAELLEQHFAGELAGWPPASQWRRRADERRQLLNRYCWNEQEGFFFDFDVQAGAQTGYQSATGLWPLWAGMASPEQARRCLHYAGEHLLCAGGLAGSSLQSRGPLGPGRPSRQWDYPFGWAPHQIFAWEGLERYGFEAEAADWAGRWTTMMTRCAADYAGTIVEKYDVEKATSQTTAEYGNVGADFQFYTREGFGWSNTAFQLGLTRCPGLLGWTIAP
jgi:alpha,alpha-trehalase